LLLLFFLSAPVRPAAAQPHISTSDPMASISELQSAVSRAGRKLASFRVEGVVCALLPGRNLVVLQDDSASALLEIPALAAPLRVGDRLELAGDHCDLTANRFWIQVGTAPVVESDGDRPREWKGGGVFLEPGRHPIRLEWFNSWDDASLKLDYERMGMLRQRVPAGVLCHQGPETNGAIGLHPGLEFAFYTGHDWPCLPDFERLTPEVSGVVTNFDLLPRKGEDSCGMVFRGLIQIAEAGVYTFHLESSNGSRLRVGSPSGRCRVRASGRQSVPVLTDYEGALAGARDHEWVELEGTVGAIAQNESGLELELVRGGERVQVIVVGRTLADLPKWLQHRVRVRGIRETVSDPERRKSARIIALGEGQISVQNSPEEMKTRDWIPKNGLAAVRQVLRLKPEKARQKIPAQIRGVVTEATSSTLVIQDSTGGVFVHYTAKDWADQPRIGDLWEIKGVTDPGDFSPVLRATRARYLGHGALPEPLRPSCNQLMNGSLDAQFVEIRGVVTAVADSAVTILLPEGKMKVIVDELRQHYADGRQLFSHRDSPSSERMRRDYLDCLVRIRGCLVPMWNPGTRQVRAGAIRLVAASVDVEETPPVNPFSLATRMTEDLLLFDPRGTLQRTKLAGQVIYAGPREYYLLDGRVGLRCLTRELFALQPGDLVEAVGFPQFEPATVELLEAQMRKTGHAPLPRPQRISAREVLDRRPGAGLVEVEAVLVHDSVQQGQWVLELQAGMQSFIARVNEGGSQAGSLAPGSRLRLTGVCAGGREDSALEKAGGFELLLNHPQNVVVLERGPWWTIRHTIAVVGVLFGGLCIALVWVKLLHRKVEVRTVQLKREIEERQLVEHRGELEQERTRVAQDLHDELGAGLTEVAILGSLAKNPAIPQEKKNDYLNQLTDLSRSLVTGLDEIVWAVNPRYDSFADLAGYYSLFAQRFLNLAGIACRLDVAAILPGLPLDSRTRHGIFLAFKEVLNNVVKHSRATQVNLKIEIADAALVISITDNGCGFKPAQGAPGQDGLTGIQRRMKKLGGRAELHDAGPGTRVELRLPMGEVAA